jgi:hypothetical protein
VAKKQATENLVVAIAGGNWRESVDALQTMEQCVEAPNFLEHSILVAKRDSHPDCWMATQAIPPQHFSVAENALRICCWEEQGTSSQAKIQAQASG